MINLRNLLKASLINDYGLNAFSRKLGSSKEKRKALLASGIVLLGISALAYTITLYFQIMADALEQIGYLEMIIIMAIMASTAMVFFTSIYKAQGSLFTSRDYDLLLSLPIKDSTILISKIINLLSLNWVFSAFILIPTSIIYFTRVGDLSWTYFLVLSFGVLLIPLIPVILASILAFFISYFASRFRYKNITIILGSILLTLGFMVSSYYTQDIIERIVLNSPSIMDMISKIYPPAAYLTKALVDLSLVDLLIFIVLSLLPFMAFILVFSRSFKQIISRLGESYRRADYEVGTLKAETPISALAKKEIRRYISIPIYILNTFIGMILLMVAAVATLFISGETLAMYMDIPYVADIFPLAILAMMGFCIGMSSTTSSSISLEGKSLWIMKSLPLRTQDIFLGKIILSLLVTLPITILANIIFYLGLDFDLSSLIWNLAISSLYCLVAAYTGLLINLYFPKLDWTSPTTVVKQSASVLVSLVVTLVTIGIPIAAFILLEVTKINIFLGLVLVGLIINLLLVRLILNSKGVEKFMEL